MRQLHHTTHVFLLLNGSVELSAITYVPDEEPLHSDTLAPNSTYQATLPEAGHAASEQGRWAKLAPPKKGPDILRAVESTAGFSRFFTNADGRKVRKWRLQLCCAWAPL